MLSAEDRRVAEDLKRRLLHAGVPLSDVRVFGSRARGDADPDSDLDVLLILRERTREIERKIGRLAWEVGYESAPIVTTFEWTRAEFQEFRLRASALLNEIRREGVPV